MSKIRTSRLPETPAPAPAARNVAFLVIPRFNLMTVMAMIEVLRIANYLSESPLYSWDLLSFDGEEIAASNGFSVRVTAPDDRIRRGETIFVHGSWNAESYTNPRALAWIRRQARAGARLGSVELGCYMLARAGLLDGRRVTTHWSWLSGFAERFSEIEVTEKLYTIDQQVLTCAGGLAGADLMLRLVGDDHGDRLAGEIADQMLHNPIRPADAPQRRTLGRGPETLPAVVRDAISLIEKSIADPVPVPEIAAALGLSQRQLERRFKAAIGCTVVQFGLLLRLQHARVLLIATDLSVREIATASGFNTLSHFASAFGACFGKRPSDYRQGWPDREATPSWPGTLSKFLDALESRGSARPLQVLRKTAL